MRENRLDGPYIRKNPVFLKEKADRKHDPRHRFYEAMLVSDTYEDYYQQAGDLKVHPATFHCGPISAHREMRYARKCGWIADR